MVRCRTCGLMRTNPRPTRETIGYYYPDDYAPYLSTLVMQGTAVERPQWKKILQRAFVFHTDSLPPLVPGRMLEVGCASGRYLHQMAQMGWDVEGVEPSLQAATRAAELGYRVTNGSIEAMPEPAAPYDLVVGWMVLEHLHEPVIVLRKLAQWVRPGGWLAISVPNAAAWEFQLFKDAWFALQLPTHTFHYTPFTLELILARGGWRMDRLLHQRVSANLFMSLNYLLRDRHMITVARLFEQLAFHDYALYFTYPISLILAFLGQTGRMTVLAQRIDS